MSFLIPLMLGVVVVGSWLIWPVIWSILTEPSDMIDETTEESASLEALGRITRRDNTMRLMPHPDRRNIWTRQ